MCALNDLVGTRNSQIAALCERYGVERLYLFGSAATGGFDMQLSDLDFLVEFADRQPTGTYADRYLDLAEELGDLFGRQVDLLTEESVQNPYFRREINETRRLVYGQPRETAAV